jgi:hypothetical protein
MRLPQIVLITEFKQTLNHVEYPRIQQNGFPLTAK